METLRRHVQALTTHKLVAEGTAPKAERKLRRTEVELLRLEEENEQLYAELSKTNPRRNDTMAKRQNTDPEVGIEGSSKQSGGADSRSPQEKRGSGEDFSGPNRGEVPEDWCPDPVPDLSGEKKAGSFGGGLNKRDAFGLAGDLSSSRFDRREG